MGAHAEKANSERKTDVLAELKYDPTVKIMDIGVFMKDVVVRFNRRGTSFSDKWKSITATKRVSGTRAAADEIIVKFPGFNLRTDGDIAVMAFKQIAWIISIPAGTSRVTVSDSCVSLEGEVEWGYQKLRVQDDVQYLAKVKGVTNLITVKPKLGAENVQSTIESAFERSALLDANKIQVENLGNKVTLREKADKYAEREKTERVAWAAAGVWVMDNQIDVKWSWGLGNSRVIGPPVKKRLLKRAVQIGRIARWRDRCLGRFQKNRLGFSPHRFTLISYKVTILSKWPKVVGIATIHGRFELKQQLALRLRDAGLHMLDFGDHRLQPKDDYPDFVIPLARAVVTGKMERGIAVCGSGAGVCVAANKISGVRACLINESFSAHQGVEDNDLNIMCLGGLVVGPADAWELFSGGELQGRRALSSPSREGHGARKPFIGGRDVKLSPLAGKPVPLGLLVDVPRLVSAYYTEEPDPALAAERVAFGTSGHRGSSFTRSFNERHILAITQAICLYRVRQKINGPLFLGIDTHALSIPACATALEVLAANGVEVMLAEGDEYTPTPVISHAILIYNRGRKIGLADGIVITPSHNPPCDGGLKYNPPNGGPADNAVTGWIETKANALLATGLTGVKRISWAKALRAATTHRHDYLGNYVADLANVIDLDVVRGAKLRLGVDSLGGAGVHYWARIAERHGLDLTVVNDVVDPTFRFMTVDWDGRIRMDPSSPCAMARLIGMKNRFDLSFACDTDHDRHGIVTQSAGLLQPNHFVAVAIYQLFQNRPAWPTSTAVGKTMVSSAMIDRVATKLGRKLYEVPVGFKWFVEGLLDGSLGFGGEESAGASFPRRGGTAWTTDKDGFIPCLLAAEITARTGRDLGELYGDLIA